MKPTIAKIAIVVVGSLVLIAYIPAPAMADCGAVTYQAGGTDDPCAGTALLGIAIADGAAIGLALTALLISWIGVRCPIPSSLPPWRQLHSTS
jgi:hypothetical protein